MKEKENFDLTSYNSYRIKAICKRACFPESEVDFVTLYTRYSPSDIVTLGGGWNVILSKALYEKIFIIAGESFSSIKKINDTVIECEAGVTTKKISEFALENDLSGAEIFYDIPSSIGGAVVMNAGASGEEIKDILVKVRYLDLQTMKVAEIDKKDINFEYRNSFFQKNTNKIVLKAWFKLAPGDTKAIREKMEKVKTARWAKQPRNYPNAGSVFKRPKGFYVGQMVEELGLKGFTIGGAKISEKHAGFIVNFNNATGEDILQIIDHVKSKVKEKYKVDLEVEQRII